MKYFDNQPMQVEFGWEILHHILGYGLVMVVWAGDDSYARELPPTDHYLRRLVLLEVG